MEHVSFVKIRRRNPVKSVKYILADTKIVTHDVVVVGLQACVLNFRFVAFVSGVISGSIVFGIGS